MKLYIYVSGDELELPLAVADSPRELAKMCNTTANVVSSSITHGKGRYKVVDVESDGEFTTPPKGGGRKGKRVSQFTFDGKFVASYKNSTEAARKYNVALSSIYNCCTGKRKTAKGYIWRFE